MSAESNMVSPCSRQTSTMRVASSACVEPQPASPPLPPNVPVPKLSPGTENPERPKSRCSMCEILPSIAMEEPWRGQSAQFNRAGGAGIGGSARLDLVRAAVLGGELLGVLQKITQISDLGLEAGFAVAHRPLLGEAEMDARFRVDAFALGQHRAHRFQPRGDERRQLLLRLRVHARQREIEGIGLEPDLAQALAAQLGERAAAVVGDLIDLARGTVALALAALLAQKAFGGQPDRKSTRLNSS